VPGLSLPGSFDTYARRKEIVLSLRFVFYPNTDSLIPSFVSSSIANCSFIASGINRVFSPNAGEEDTKGENNGPTDFHEILLKSLKTAQLSTINGKYLIETKCPQDRPVTPGYR